ncbi:MAG TPA: response regulator [Bryobacteraceae bacterium]|nr:response regulator [Bryobacteraceae bacterium]
MERTDLDQWRAREVARLLALVETQRRYYQEIVASIPVGLMVLSSDLNILLANGTARKIFGLQAGDSSHRRMDTILPTALLDRIEEVLKTGVSEVGVRVETNRDKRLRVGILAIRNWDEEAAQEALLSIEDLTSVEAFTPMEAPPAAEIPVPEVPAAPAPAVSASEFIDNLDAILWAVELPSMNFVFASPQAAKLLGFPPEHWTSHPSFWLDRVHNSDRDWVAQSYQHAIESGAPHSCEFQAITSGGGSVWLREYSRFLPAAEGQPRYMIGVAVDVTERRMLEDQLMQAERVEAVSRLASRMAHDLNNTLMILTGYSEELLTALPAGSTMRSDVQEILTATERMGGLTSQLLSFARRQGPAAAEMELESALGKMSARLNALLGTHVGIDMRISGEPNRIHADAQQLEQVVTAIVERARQGMHAGQRITLETSRLDITEDLRRPNAPLQPGSYAVISIVAPSQPLDAEAKAAMFECSLPGKEPWDDLAATLSRSYGTVRQWGGDISVSNGPHAATVFRIFLPRLESQVVIGSEPGTTAVEAPTPAPEPPAPLATILVVEDEAGIRALVRKILRRQGYEVLEAANGEDALALCREHGPRVELLITDVLMPQMGGRELVERLQTQGHAMKVLYVSGYTDDTTIYSGDLPAGTAFLQKPFTLGSLLDKVKEVLAK